MRGLLVLVVLSWWSNARADVKLLGWSSAGHGVIEWKDASTHELQTCAPVEIDSIRATASPPPACKRCAAATGDAAKECGLVTRVDKPVSSLASPDKRLKLESKMDCVKMRSIDTVDCNLSVGFRDLDFITRSDDTSAYKNKKPQWTAVWRPDSKAVMVDLWNMHEGTVREDIVWVLDTSALHGKADAPKDLRKLVDERLANPVAQVWGTTSATFFTDDASQGALDAIALATATKLGAGPVALRGAPTFGMTTNGKGAWATYTATVGGVAWRVTELFAREQGTWRVASGFWSRGMLDSVADRRAPDLKAVPLVGKDEIAPDLDFYVKLLRGTAAAWTKDDTFGAQRAGTITLGTQPKERVGGGKALDRALLAWLKGGLVVGNTRAVQQAATGWIAMSLTVTKRVGGKSLAVPVRAYFIVDTSASGAAQGVVVTHLAVPQ